MEVIFRHPRCQQFIDALDKHTRAKITRLLDTLEVYRQDLSMPYARKIMDNVYELRIRGKQEVRLFYSFVDSDIVLLHGFLKKTQKIPRKEIEIVTKRLRDLTYL